MYSNLSLLLGHDFAFLAPSLLLYSFYFNCCQERHAAKTVGEMKQFVSHLPQMQHAKQSLAVHTSIAELIKEFTGWLSHLQQMLLTAQPRASFSPFRRLNGSELTLV